MIVRELVTKFSFSVNPAGLAQLHQFVHTAQIALQGLVSVANGVAGALDRVVGGAVRAGDAIDANSRKLGVSAEEYQALEYAARATDTSIEALTQSSRALSVQMEAAREGGSDAAKAFAALGVRTTDTAGKMRPVADVLVDTIDALGGVDEQSRQTALAQQVLGRGALEVLPAIRAGRGEFRASANDARESFAVMRGSEVKALADLKTSGESATVRLSGMANALVGRVAPALQRVVDRVSAWLDKNKAFIDQRMDRAAEMLSRAVDGIGVAFDFALVAARPFLAVIEGIERLGEGLLERVFSPEAARAFLTTGPLGAIIHGLRYLLAVLQDISKYAEGQDSAIGRLLNKLARAKPEDPWFIAMLREGVKLVQELTTTLMSLLGVVNLFGADKARGVRMLVGMSLNEKNPAHENARAIRDWALGFLSTAATPAGAGKPQAAGASIDSRLDFLKRATGLDSFMEALTKTENPAIGGRLDFMTGLFTQPALNMKQDFHFNIRATDAASVAGEVVDRSKEIASDTAQKLRGATQSGVVR